MSFSQIGAITKAFKEEMERESGQSEMRNDDDYDIKSKSKTTQVIKLFSEGKNLVEVVIALDLPADEVRVIYREFLELTNMRKLVEIYDEIEDYLPPFLELFKIFHSRGLGRNEVLEILRITVTGELPYLLERVDYLRSQVNWLENEVRRKERNLWILGF
jgi:hypothetical protein